MLGGEASGAAQARRAGGRAESLPGRGRSVPAPALPAARLLLAWVADRQGVGDGSAALP